MMNDTYGKLTIYDWNPTIATGNGSATIAAGDVLVGGETLEDILPNAGKPALLSSLGSFNGVVSITDAHAVSVLGVIVVETTDYTDWIASQRGQVKNVNLILRAKPGAAEPRDLRAGIIDRTGGAWTPSGLTVRFGIVHT